MLDQGYNLWIGSVVRFLFWQVDQFIFTRSFQSSQLIQWPNAFYEKHIFVVVQFAKCIYFMSFLLFFGMLFKFGFNHHYAQSFQTPVQQFCTWRFRLITLLRWRIAFFRFMRFQLSIFCTCWIIGYLVVIKIQRNYFFISGGTINF